MFNVGREFNKIASTQGAGFFGALPQANRKQELRFAGDSLRNISKIKAAQEGIAMAEAEGAANRRNSLFNSIIGGFGNIAGSALTAGIQHGFGRGGVGGFSAGDAQVMGMPSGQADVISRGGTTYWDTDMPTNSWINMSPGGGISGLGKNPYSINTTGW